MPQADFDSVRDAIRRAPLACRKQTQDNNRASRIAMPVRW
jgi:hypothetical protein